MYILFASGIKECKGTYLGMGKGIIEVEATLH